MVFEGIHDGIYPWSGRGDMDEIWDEYEILSFLTGEDNGNQTADSDGAMTEDGAQEGPEATEEVQTVREFGEVGENYFDDAVFIGDSRTVGLRDYGGLDQATFYATVGLNIYDMWTEKFCEVGGKKVTLEEALGQRQYGKIYFQIGINEMGRGNLESFMQQYEASVQKFRQLQPDAVVGIDQVFLEVDHSGHHQNHHHCQGNGDEAQNICHRPAAPIAADVSVGAAHSSPPVGFWKILVNIIL